MPSKVLPLRGIGYSQSQEDSLVSIICAKYIRYSLSNHNLRGLETLTVDIGATTGLIKVHNVRWRLIRREDVFVLIAMIEVRSQTIADLANGPCYSLVRDRNDG